MAAMDGKESLPLLHKYVLQPKDDFHLVLAKLNYRLCVRDVSRVLYRRSKGDSISEAVEYCEQAPESILSSSHSFTQRKPHQEEEDCHDMSQTLNGGQMEPLVFEDMDASHYMSSSKNCSPSGDSYTCTMKSDDSGLGLDDSHLNMSSDTSDMSLSVHATSPISEGHDHIFPSEASRSPPVTILEDIIEAKEQDYAHSPNDIDEFFNRENGELSPHVESKSQLIEDIPVIQVQESPESPTSDIVEEEFRTPPDGAAEEEAGEGEEEEVEEEEKPEYVRDEDLLEIFESGLRCSDVDTALLILKTKYRLHQPSVRKFIITFSAWDLSQIMNGPDRHKTHWKESLENLAADNEQVDDLMEKIYSRQGEISDLVDAIMEADALKKRLIRAQDAQSQSAEPQAVEEPVIQEENEEPHEEQPKEPASSDAPKKRQRNIFQRLVSAIRKRVRRNRGEQTNRKNV